MSFKGTLEIADEKSNILDFRVRIYQPTDKSGKVSANPVGGEFEVTIETTKSTLLFEWMTSPVQLKNGKLVFYRRDEVSKLREYEFKEAYCVSYTEEFSSDTNSPFITTIVVSAKTITINGQAFEKNWPKSA